VERGEITNVAAFSNNVASIIREHEILRLKGFAAVIGRPMRMTVQAVGPRIESYYDKPFGSDPRITRFVVIGQAGMDQGVITKALQA
jgi:cobalamin biosynthesis protein CobW